MSLEEIMSNINLWNVETEKKFFIEALAIHIRKAA